MRATGQERMREQARAGWDLGVLAGRLADLAGDQRGGGRADRYIVGAVHRERRDARERREDGRSLRGARQGG